MDAAKMQKREKKKKSEAPSGDYKLRLFIGRLVVRCLALVMVKVFVVLLFDSS